MIIKLLTDRTVLKDGKEVILKAGTEHEFDGKRTQQYLDAKIAKPVKKEKVKK